MPSHPHDALIELFRPRPTPAAERLGDVLGVQLPAHQEARVDPAKYVDLHPTEYRPDAVVVLSGGPARCSRSSCWSRCPECTDYGLLKIWMRRARTAESIGGVF